MKKRQKWNPLCHTRAAERWLRAWRKRLLPPPDPAPVPVEEVLRARFRDLRPIRFRRHANAPARVTVVTDSISPGSLFGGVATAMIFSALLARRLEARLRILTRIDPPATAAVDDILQVHGIRWDPPIEFGFADRDSVGDEITCGEKECFVTTSWWTTWSVRESLPAERIVYLLQEDERMFYAYDDLRLRCEELLADRDLRYVVNSKLLFDHLRQSGLDHLETCGQWFEPAFPSEHYFREKRAAGGKGRFMFYARPGNVRNLYHRGLEVIERAIGQGLLAPEQWDFCFVGKDLRPLRLKYGVRPKLLQNLPWQQYVSFIRQVDLGLCLMYTPHPSYPPLDLAASGAVVVTNRCENKQSLDLYSKNILCADPSVEDLVEALEQGRSLALDEAAREDNYRSGGFARSWQASLESCLDGQARRLKP